MTEALIHIEATRRGWEAGTYKVSAYPISLVEDSGRASGSFDAGSNGFIVLDKVLIAGTYAGAVAPGPVVARSAGAQVTFPGPWKALPLNTNNYWLEIQVKSVHEGQGSIAFNHNAGTFTSGSAYAYLVTPI